MSHRSLVISRKPYRLQRRGAAILSVTLLLGGLIIEIGLLGVFLFYLVNYTNYGIRVSSEAFAGAQAGIAEGILRLARYKCFTTTDPITSDLGTATFRVTVSGLSVCDGTGTMTRTVTAWGASVTKQRKLEAVVDIDRETGVILAVRLEEVSL